MKERKPIPTPSDRILASIILIENLRVDYQIFMRRDNLGRCVERAIYRDKRTGQFVSEETAYAILRAQNRRRK